MAFNLTIEKRAKDVTYFGDIGRGEFFLVGGQVFVKLAEFFIADEIIEELEYQHDLQHEYDIDSNRYNSWLVGSESAYRSFDSDVVVDRVNIDMNVRYVE